MKIVPCRIRGAACIAASFSEGRVAIADYEAQSAYCVITLPDSGTHLIDVSADGQRLVVCRAGEDYSRVQVYAIDSGECLDDLRTRRHILGVAIEQHGARVLYETYSAIYLWTVGDESVVKVGGAALLGCGGYAYGQDTMHIPATRRRQLYVVRWHDMMGYALPVDTKAAVISVACSPVEPTGVLVDGKAHLYSYDCRVSSVGQPIAGKGCGRACYTTNGALVVVGGTQYAWVWDKMLSRIVKTIAIDGPVAGALDDARVLCTSGKVVNVLTGDMDDGPSTVKWWRVVGL